MRGRTVRVLVLDTTVQRRARLERMLEGDPLLLAMGGAGNALQATDVAQRREVDVILLGLPGAAAHAVGWVSHIMRTRPLPIVVVAPGNRAIVQERAFALMEAGAIAVLREPGQDGPTSGDELAGLQQTLHLMAEVKVVRRSMRPPVTPADGRPVRSSSPTPRIPSRPAPAAPPAAPWTARGVAAEQKAGRVQFVAIGASTGGPVALKTVLCTLPASFPVPILIVQHIAHGFVDGLAAWLSASCAVRTEVARPGTQLEAGRAYIAPDGVHMRVGADGRLEFDAGPPVNGHRPAVSCLFASIAARCAGGAIAVLLTGMGKDGAAELKMLKDGGAVTIAQDQASSVIHGMPGEAIRCGAATYVMSPEEIAAALPALAAK